MNLITFVMTQAIDSALTAWERQFGTKPTLQQSAEKVVNDVKFGSECIPVAIAYGDRIIPLLKVKTRYFQELYNHNASRIATVLGSIDSELARQTLIELHGSQDELIYMTGALGLCMQGHYPEAIHKDAGLAQIIKHSHCQASKEMALIALGYTGSTAALPAIHQLFAKHSEAYCLHALACEALARIHDASSIPVLRTYLQEDTSYALPIAYRVLIALGDREATGLAIKRIPVISNDDNITFLIAQLMMVTGKRYGLNPSKWENWWTKHGNNWTIPEQYLSAWDQQSMRIRF